jgi:O-antigen/teichoic acid export membrane protein
VAGQFFEGLNSFLFAGLIAALWARDAVPGAAGVVLAFCGCQFLAVALMWGWIGREARRWAPAVPADGVALTRAGLPIMTAQGADMLADWLLLALIAVTASVAEVGAMRVAMQVVMIIFIVVSTGENLLAARIAGDLRAGRADLVWQRHHRATLAMAAILGPLVLVLVVFPEPLMTLAFGQAFAVAAPALAIMALGQGSKLLTGPSGILLSMAGRERQTLIITLSGFGLMLGTALVLIPLWGLAGAATAHAVTTAFRYGASYVVARYYIRAQPLI